ncbi:cellulose synthase/poly-beta-1,6-N-acetylglucosamine synthase-like glycosyltransferase [Mucilaginibacter yixingensis]|uniref:Cellulose synthase/poly-beta-1,6-N-acetylglucosamine synthase-like glycosyltransferase n=1 Tax=Mucilaginibacter yixingensis TaxID=1295612 RepID=A0A2T5JAN5_9SPHI|nr:glycosyltransferase [Mucilaginibacter yixingensis]PTQ97916.1 cellulose synthase/poly-beta-1,6-N-acetylglucosamine synthase-like glycosyltransferase [Mucilaginibacter yixingensis]
MIAPPSKKQLINLRLMIIIGLGCMAFFAFELFRSSAHGYRPLYYLLVVTFVFTAGKVLYEWYHYWTIKINKTPPPGKAFTVDMFTTFCAGEPYEMIVETLEALQAITYPHETYLCDEADDAYLKGVCQKLGVHHVTRTNKINAKAGNINNALKHSKGDLCVVLDPDHVPFPNFLDPIVSHFNDPEVGYVQVVQAYSNQDQGWIAKGAAQQTYQYYGPMMMTMNAYGTAQAIGANCTFRREALESIGGHAAGLAEDMHTSMQMHAHGWKSIYVPAVLSLGLVPATLSAYYKQQLKWSRGVFELLVTSYITLFRKFTWRQKLHYGLVPMFYLSGFIYLLNFLIPIISLFGDVYPLRMDFSVFAVVTLPFIMAVILIRHYVQRWVMEEQERGFHIIGGLLLIGTWWVFIVGFLYTIIRKKVPYIPTPKDDTEEQSLGINLPNIIVLCLSLAAIGYGLYHDWNPFTITMAAICGINCFFMVFMLMASQQLKVRSYQKKHQKLSAVSSNIGAFKRKFWLFRRRIYSGIRSVSLLLIILSVCVAVYVSRKADEIGTITARPNHKDILLTGIFEPAKADDGLTDMNRVAAVQRASKTNFDIISIYLPWGDQPQSALPTPLLENIYSNHSTPMITWEPWQNLFKGSEKQRDEHVFTKITSGQYDAYITNFAKQLRALNRPVFLRFAHEADNPFYPWSATGNNTPEQFKAAWKYVHDLFVAHGAWNVIWVWNPWRAEAAEDYFPGRAYVDWIGITGLNYGHFRTDRRSHSLKELYMPFHELKLNHFNLPVMIAETGSADPAANEWVKAGIQSVKKDFPEVKAMVFFNSAFDKTVPNYSAPAINWHLDSLPVPQNIKRQEQLSGPVAVAQTAVQPLPATGFAPDARGVLYAKGQNWYGNAYAITRQTISTDFKDMRAAGLNTVKVYGPGIYDHITLQAARETGMNVCFSFYIPEPVVFTANNNYLPKLGREILKTVNSLKSNATIKYWNIGSPTLQQLGNDYLQPELFYRRQAYVLWLKNIVEQIKKIDPSRSVTVDVNVTGDLTSVVAQLHDQVPQIDAFGLVWKEKLKDTTLIKQLAVPYYFSSVKPEFYFQFKGLNTGAVMSNWQDQQTASGVTFDGLKDIWGRNKPDFYEVTKHWTSDTSSHTLPLVKILRPSLATVPGDELPYYAMAKTGGKWHLLPAGLKFEWYQVHTDRIGTPLEITILSKSPYINYRIPENPDQYRLYLIATYGNQVSTAYSILNIPFKNEEEPEEK